MKRSITKDLTDVSFHDSTIECFERSGDTVTITFDWAMLTCEHTQLIVDKCYLHLFRVSSDSLSPAKHCMTCLGAEYSLIGTNSSKSDNDLILGGFYQTADDTSWVEWKSEFDSFRLEWDEEVTLDEWQSGKLPKAEPQR